MIEPEPGIVSKYNKSLIPETEKDETVVVKKKPTTVDRVRALLESGAKAMEKLEPRLKKDRVIRN